MALLPRLLSTHAHPATFFVRLAVGWVFLSEGIQKFLFSAELGAGRFAKIGIPAPEFFGPFVGLVEIVGGTLLVLGLLTRFAALPLVVDMVVAIATTKVPILTDKGLWAASHEARTDLLCLFASLYLLIAGAGSWSLDARLGRR